MKKRDNRGRLRAFFRGLQRASATSLTITADKLQQIVDNMDVYGRRIVLRPQEISNHPGVIRRLGVVGMNTAYTGCLELGCKFNFQTHACACLFGSPPNRQAPQMRRPDN